MCKKVPLVQIIIPLMWTMAMQRGILPGRESDSDPEDLEHAEKFCQVKAVLEEVL
ncbi:hypothetical protein YC2023_072925 [Brassica napus]